MGTSVTFDLIGMDRKRFRYCEVIAHLASFLHMKTVFLVAGAISAHDVGPGRGLLSLLDQIGEGFVHQGLELPALLLAKARTAARVSELTWVANFRSLSL